MRIRSAPRQKKNGKSKTALNSSLSYTCRVLAARKHQGLSGAAGRGGATLVRACSLPTHTHWCACSMRATALLTCDSCLWPRAV
jgi:hypothetical protein